MSKPPAVLVYSCPTKNSTSKIEYGYLKDVEIKDTTDSIRLFSNPDTISKYELTAGKHAEKDDEIVLSDTYKSQYHIGDTLKVTEKESAGTKVLKKHTFKIVGFAKSPEFLSSSQQPPVQLVV